MAGAGGLVALLLGIDGKAGQALVIAVVGVLMIVYVLVGGMKGTTWVQIIKAVLLIAGAGVMTMWVLGKFGFNSLGLLGAPSARTPPRAKPLLAPGAAVRRHATSQLDFISLALALVLGTAGLPHVLMRFYTVPTAKEARRSVVWAIGLIGAFYLFTLVLGYGAAALVGPDAILAAPGGVNSAAPLLAFELGGAVLLGVISAVAFATILAVVAGPDHHRVGLVRPRHLRQRAQARARPTPDSEVRVARITAVVIGVAGHRRRHPRQRAERRVPGGAGLRGRRLRPTCRRSSTRCTGSGSTPAARCGASTAAWSRAIVLIVFSPAVSGSGPKTVDDPGA